MLRSTRAVRRLMIQQQQQQSRQRRWSLPELSRSFDVPQQQRRQHHHVVSNLSRSFGSESDAFNAPAQRALSSTVTCKFSSGKSNDRDQQQQPAHPKDATLNRARKGKGKTLQPARSLSSFLFKDSEKAGIQSTEELNESIAKWQAQEGLTVTDFENALEWLEENEAIENHEIIIKADPDPTSFGLLLEGVLKRKQQRRDFIPLANVLLERLINSVIKSSTTTTTTTETAPTLPPRLMTWYFHHVMTGCIRDARQTRLAQEWLETWWTCHSQYEDVIPKPTPEAYSMIMSGWAKEGEPKQALSLLQDMTDPKRNVQAQVAHYETCLNAFVRSVALPKAPNNQRSSSVGYDAENVILQMNQAGEIVDAADRSWQTRILQSFNKVIHCWVDSRERDAAARVTAILDLMQEVFQENKASAADWSALAEAYSHAIRSWSHLATTRKNGSRKTLPSVSDDDYQDPAMYTKNLLLRLEELIDASSSSSTAFSIPLKLWRRSYGGAIAAYGRDGDKTTAVENCQHARTLWVRFHDRGYGEPDITLFNHLFHVYGKMGAVRESQNLWQELTTKGTVHADLKTYNWRLLAYKNSSRDEERFRNHKQAKQVWKEITAEGLMPDSVSYNTYLSTFIGLGDLEMAQEGHDVFREFLSCRSDRACQASTVSLNAWLRIWSTLAKEKDASSEREEALRSVLTVLMEVQKLTSKGLLAIQPNYTTKILVSQVLDANNVAEEKQVGVFRLLDNMSG